MSAVDIFLERETANDESALVVAVHVVSGVAVEKDDVLFDIENSKATQEVVAPEGGFLSHDLKIGQTVRFGVPIARILPQADLRQMDWRQTDWRQEADGAANPATVLPQPAAWPPRPEPAEARDRPRREPRFSHAAALLCAEHGLQPADFAAGFVTVQDVRARVLPPKTARPVVAAVDGPTTAKPIATHKRAEINALSRGAGDTMLSVLGTSLGALDIARAENDYMDGRITDLVIYEAARLMRKYPKLNAFYEDGQIFEHASVHAGLAIDGGGHLVVYGIADADQLHLEAVSDTIADAVARYAANELTNVELSRATFTVTDLSADDLDFVLPLLPRGQSCIIGITQSAATGFRLYAGFDHRITEGREVASFLGELRDRVRSFVASRPAAPSLPRCFRCDRSSAEAVARFGDKGLLKIADREGRDAFCCWACWNGW